MAVKSSPNRSLKPATNAMDKELREAFPHDSAMRHLIFDRDAIFSDRVLTTVKALGLRPARTAFRSLWQNGVARALGRKRASRIARSRRRLSTSVTFADWLESTLSTTIR